MKRFTWSSARDVQGGPRLSRLIKKSEDDPEKLTYQIMFQKFKEKIIDGWRKLLRY